MDMHVCCVTHPLFFCCDTDFKKKYQKKVRQQAPGDLDVPLGTLSCDVEHVTPRTITLQHASYCMWLFSSPFYRNMPNCKGYSIWNPDGRLAGHSKMEFWKHLQIVAVPSPHIFIFGFPSPAQEFKWNNPKWKDPTRFFLIQLCQPPIHLNQH